MSEKNKPEVTIEQKIKQLDEAVAWFSSDDFVLAEATERYKSTQKLADEIQKDLADMKLVIERVDDAK